MTIFTRTNFGLTNLPLFHSVDFIIFIEGGNRSLSVEEVLAEGENLAPEDTRFWKSIFDKNGVKKSYALKPIGSKSSVIKIATKIESGEIRNIVVAMDRDLDDYFGRKLESPFILYTYGYSWESDVYTKELTKAQIASFLFMEPLEPAVECEIDSAYGAFERVGSKIARLEMIFRSQGVKWISEARGERFFRPENAGILDRVNLRKSINECKIQVQRPATCPVPQGVRLNPYRVNCGKLLRALSVSIMRYIVKKYGSISSLQNGVIAAVMLERFCNSDKHVKSDYYSSAVKHLNNALS